MGRHTQHFRTNCWFPRRFLLLLPGLLVLGPGSAWAQAPELRTWTSGDYKVQAKFVSLANGKVTLEQADGETLEIELKQLSAADQKYVTEQQQKAESNPFKKKTSSPFQKKGKNAAAGERGTSAGEDEGSGRLVKPDWSAVQQLTTTSSGTDWSVPVTSKAHPAGVARLRPVAIPRTTGFFQGPKGVVLNGAGTKALVAYAGAQPGADQTGVTRIAACDLESGNLLSAAGVHGLYAPLALRDDGMQAVMRTDAFGPGRHDTLEFWNLSKTGVVKGDQWIPYEHAEGSGGGDRDVRWATFLGPERLATISESGNLVIWQVKPLKPLAALSVQSGCTPALSPDGELLAIATSKEIGILDVAKLEVIALQAAPMQNMAWTSFAFSPTGKRLACKVFVNKVFVYDVAKGELHREISLQGLNTQQTPAIFSDDDHLIVGDHTLIDAESQVRLWQYQGNEHTVASNGVCWFEVAARQNQAGALIPGKIPTAEVQRSLERAMRDPNFFIVKPGSSASIDVSGIPDASRRNEVIQSLTTNLSKIGVKVAAGSPVTFQAALEQGQEKEISYRSIGRGFQVDRFKVRPWLARIMVVYDGQTAWESSGSSVPFFDVAHLKKDESLQDHVRKLEQPNYAYFLTAELPKLLTRPMGQAAGTLGASTVSLSGIR
jgi:hypothetical protein